MNVEGQPSWEPSSKIKTFVGNLYLLSADGTQIFKHKPGVNGFTAKTPVIEGGQPKQEGVIDFGIDGSIYLLKSDLTFQKIFTVPAFSKKGILLNKLPDNYSVESDDAPVKLYLSPTANYLYLVLDHRLWIFEPDSRNPKNVRSLKFIGQIEIQERKIESIVILKDGEFVALTESGISNVKFEVSDGKINIR